jgi:glycosyltransferase involved in cell wall biosynthesis
MRIPLSVVVITRDEERHIRRCLGSVRAARLRHVRVVEVLVVDSGSRDRTVPVARAMGARTFRRGWPGYSAQKNWAFSRCRGKWILSLDADEEMTPALWTAIDRALPACPAEVAGFAIPRKAFFLGGWMRHGGWWPDRQVRLIRKGKGAFEGVLHEGIRVEGGVATLVDPMNHHSYETLGDYFRKMEEYSTVTARHASGAKRVLWPMYLLFKPPFVLFKMLVLKAGFLDGWRGFLLAGLSAWHEALKYWKTGEMAIFGR